MFRVEVIYIDARQAVFQAECRISQGTTVAQVIQQCGFAESIPETGEMAIAIFSGKVSPDTVLYGGERIEICRPLALSPMQNRRVRARKSTGK